MRAYRESESMARRASEIVPGGAMSNLRRAALGRPIFYTKGEGARLWDVDGNEYIDYVLSAGPAILGYGNPHLAAAIKGQVERMHCAYGNNDLEVLASEKVVQHLPAVEMVRFTTSGTQANMAAMRVARACTARDKFVRFHGHYHGGADFILGGTVHDPENPVVSAGVTEGDYWSMMGDTAGRAKGALEQAYMVQWNDLQALEEVLVNFGQDIAAVIMEPIMTNSGGCMPEPGYLEGVRVLCDRYKIILIFDEVVTGFRVGLGGAQGYFGVTPDLTVLGKALGGGVPVAAFGGKRELMDVLARGEVIEAGTYNGNPLSMAAVVATIEVLETDDGAVFDHMFRMGTMLKLGLDEIAKEHEQNVLMQGVPTVWVPSFTDQQKITNQAGVNKADLEKRVRFGKLLKEHGVLAGQRWCISAAHTQEDVAETLERANDAMKKLREELV